jgi:hypothetical protein
MGVLTGLTVDRGGDDGELWSYDSNATEIKVSFSIRPLISKLVMTATQDGPSWFLKNNGLQEYLGGLCGVDLRNNRIEMAMEMYKTLFQGQMSAFFNNMLTSIIANTFISDVTNFFGNMLPNFFDGMGKNEQTSSYEDNGDNYESIEGDEGWNHWYSQSNTL